MLFFQIADLGWINIPSIESGLIGDECERRVLGLGGSSGIDGRAGGVDRERGLLEVAFGAEDEVQYAIVLCYLKAIPQIVLRPLHPLPVHYSQFCLLLHFFFQICHLQNHTPP